MFAREKSVPVVKEALVIEIPALVLFVRVADFIMLRFNPTLPKSNGLGDKSAGGGGANANCQTPRP